MAGLISSSDRNFEKILPTGPSTIYYKPTACSDQQTSFKVDYNPKVSETEGRERSMFNAALNSFKAPELKPNPFYPQQNKIIYFRGPLYNDTYHLDVSNVDIPKNAMPGQVPLPNEQFKQLRNPNLINPGQPKRETGVYYNTQVGETRPQVSMYQTKKQNPNNGVFTRKYTSYGSTNANRDVSLPTNKVPSLHQPKTNAFISTNRNVPYRKIPQDQNIMMPQQPRVYANFPLF